MLRMSRGSSVAARAAENRMSVQSAAFRYGAGRFVRRRRSRSDLSSQHSASLGRQGRRRTRTTAGAARQVTAIHDREGILQAEGTPDLSLLSGLRERPRAAGYLEWLRTREPEITFDPSTLHTKKDWIASGKLVFESDTRFFPASEQPAQNETAWPVAKDGKLPGFVVTFRYYIRKKGVIEEGANACAGCHTRIMPDGSFVEGTQRFP